MFCEIISQSYSFHLKKPFAKTVLVELAKWYLEAHRGQWWKRKYPQMKSGKKLSEEPLSVLWLSLTELHLYFVDLFVSLICVESENRNFESLWRLYCQRKYPPITKERSFLRSFFLFCEINSQSYSFPLKKPFAKTVPVELAKWYLEAHRGLWFKRQYPQIKSGKKLSEKLLSVLLIHLTELHLYFLDLFASLISVESGNRYLASLWRL